MLIHSSNNYNKTNFGMAIKSTKQAAEFLETHLTPSGAKYLNKIIESQAKNPVDILLRLEKAQSGHPCPSRPATRRCSRARTRQSATGPYTPR